MKIARFTDGGTETFGLVRDGAVSTREELQNVTGVALPLDAGEFMFDGYPEQIKGTLDSLPYSRKISEFCILPPVNNPPKILCLAFNYMEHAKVQGTEPSDDPVVFIKPRTALCGHDSEVLCPDFVTQLDYEAELALVIGRKCKNVNPEKAREAIFGYTIMNDVSARDIQFRDKQFTRAKGFDTFAPCGPWVTTTDEVPDPENLKITTKVNGSIRQDSSTANMHIKPFEIVSRLSRAMTLERGDIISTGTPYGSVLNDPGPGYLADGDVIEMEIEGVGMLRNVVRVERRGA